MAAGAAFVMPLGWMWLAEQRTNWACNSTGCCGNNDAGAGVLVDLGTGGQVST